MLDMELLAPAGSVESLFVAVDSGCNAVYFGLEAFNARSRAKNFKVEELSDIIDYCHKRGVKCYLTLNTLIKNSEIRELVKLLYKIMLCQPDAIIIQDIALFHYLQNLNFKHIHLSTQAGIHNSLGTAFATKVGVERSILARELTLSEIKACSQQGETEIFVHGALCYSLSGYCLFSSYLGGMSANRGKCKQPCRRAFNFTKRKREHLFSLKDMELINYLPQLAEVGVKSLKIEGRMKRPEYVEQVVKAYRLALDSPGKVDDAVKILDEDYGRNKTSYFVGGNVSKAITNQPFAGILIGTGDISGDRVICTSECEVSVGEKLKFYAGEVDSETYTVEELLSPSELLVSPKPAHSGGVTIYKVSSGENRSYPISFKRKSLPTIPNNELNALASIHTKNSQNQNSRLYLRLKSCQGIKSIPQTKLEQHYLIPVTDFKSSETNKYSRYRDRVIWELPLFIAEADIEQVRSQVNNIHASGFRNFAISHISQLLLIPKRCSITSNENVYALNDVAITQLKEWGVSNWILPLENEIPNLHRYQNRDGIVPIFFTPALFSSRMPVQERTIRDNRNSYLIKREGKLTITYPTEAVCIFSFLNKIKDFKNYLIDLSTPNITPDMFQDIFHNFQLRKNLPNSTKFNHKKGLW